MHRVVYIVVYILNASHELGWVAIGERNISDPVSTSAERDNASGGSNGRKRDKTSLRPEQRRQQGNAVKSGNAAMWPPEPPAISCTLKALPKSSLILVRKTP